MATIILAGNDSVNKEWDHYFNSKKSKWLYLQNEVREFRKFNSYINYGCTNLSYMGLKWSKIKKSIKIDKLFFIDKFLDFVTFLKIIEACDRTCGDYITIYQNTCRVCNKRTFWCRGKDTIIQRNSQADGSYIHHTKDNRHTVSPELGYMFLTRNDTIVKIFDNNNKPDYYPLAVPEFKDRYTYGVYDKKGFHFSKNRGLDLVKKLDCEYLIAKYDHVNHTWELVRIKPPQKL